MYAPPGRLLAFTTFFFVMAELVPGLVECLLAHRVSAGTAAGDTLRKGTSLYKVRWAGCGEEDDSWEPKYKIAAELREEFHQREKAEPSSPAAPGKRVRPGGSALSPSAKSPEGKR